MLSNPAHPNINPRGSRAITIGAIAWVLNIEVFITQFIAQSAAPGYDYVNDDISLLGVTRCGPLTDPMTQQVITGCSPLHTVLNAGFVVMGLSVLIGALLTRRNWPGKTGAVGTWLLAVAALGTIASGLAPLNENLPIHILGAMVYFPLSAIAICLIGLSVRKDQAGFALFSYACGAIAFLAFFAYGSYQAIGLPRGILERIAAYPSTVWFIVAGVLLLMRRRKANGLG